MVPLERLQSVFDGNFLQFFLSLFGLEHLIELVENFLEGLGVVSSLEGAIFLEEIGEMESAVVGNLNSSVAIEDGEEKDVLVDSSKHDSVLHVLSPP